MTLQYVAHPPPGIDRFARAVICHDGLALRELDVSTPDGRTLRVLDRGPEDGAPVLVHNGTPNSRLLFGHTSSGRRRAACG
jgi:hypothetical protein